LSGSVLEGVQSFQVTENNYKKALERLDARYDNDVLIFSDCISKHPSSSAFQRLIDNALAIRGSLLFTGSAEQVMNGNINYILLSKVEHETETKNDETQDYEKLATWDDCCTILQILEGHRPLDHSTTQNPKQSQASKTFLSTLSPSCRNTDHQSSNARSANKHITRCYTNSPTGSNQQLAVHYFHAAISKALFQRNGQERTTSSCPSLTRLMLGGEFHHRGNCNAIAVRATSSV